MSTLEKLANLATQTENLAQIEVVIVPPVAGETYKNPTLKTVQDMGATTNYFYRTPLLNLFTKNGNRRVFGTTQEYTKTIRSNLDVNGNPLVAQYRQELDCACNDANGRSIVISQGLAALCYAKCVSQYDLQARINQNMLISAMSSADAVREATNWLEAIKRPLISEMARTLEQSLWNGQPSAANPMQVIGLKTMILKFASAFGVNAAAAGAENQFFNNIDYGVTGTVTEIEAAMAFAKNIQERMACGVVNGCEHYTLFVARGKAGKLQPYFREIFAQGVQAMYLINNQADVNALNNGIGDNFNFTDANGSIKINDYLTIQELDYIDDENAVLYPDTIYGTYQFQQNYYLEEKKGINMYAASDRKEILNKVGLGDDAIIFKSDTTKCGQLCLSVEWDGSFSFDGAYLACLYTNVGIIGSGTGYVCVDVLASAPANNAPISVNLMLP
jgi:hypothetical protein